MSRPTPPGNFDVIESGVEDGIHWITARAPLYDAVNGYAFVPQGHLWHGLGYHKIPTSYDEPNETFVRVPTVDVHGGLTYSARGWIGFDTQHSGDYWPGMPTYGLEPIIAWTLEMVTDEARSLARQIAEAGR